MSNIPNLRKHLECPVCLLVPYKGKIYQCANGHLVCGTCFRRTLSRCPTCRQRLGKYRCLVAEQVLSELPMPCVNADSGCPEVFLKDELANHESECRFRLVHCPESSCREELSLNMLVRHIQNQHQSDRQANNPPVVTIVGNLSRECFSLGGDYFEDSFSITPFEHFQIGSEHFFSQIWRTDDRLEGQWFFWVYYLGSRREAQNYDFSITLGTRDVARQTYRATTVSIDDFSFDSLTRNGKPYVLTDYAVEMLAEDNKVYFVWEIHQR